MRRLLIAVSLFVFSVPTLSLAQDLALKRVMLSSAGLGYFEYEATVDGDAALKLTVPLDQVDDVLKSLVVYDDKGGIGGLSLPGKEPLKQVFKDLPFDENSLLSTEGLLTALKGARVTVSGSRSISGRIVSLQPEATSASKDGATPGAHNRVTLLTESGLQQFVIEDMGSLQFDDPAIRAKLVRALDAIEANRGTESRTLELSTKGQGRRAVRVAYIVSVPVWKASYRMTLPADMLAPKAALQGWATIENMSGQDWKGVEITLVAGRPVAFHQALYEAYYVTRPDVPVEVAGKLMPTVDRGGVAAKTDSAMPPPLPAAPAPMPMQRARQAEMVAVPAGAMAAEQFEAAEAATQVTFKFPRAVDLGNGRTLSIPMIDRQVPAERLALYQADTAARNPLAAIRLVNDGETGLPAGILTLYERDKANAVSYIGDARLSAFPTGEARLLPYALDEKITIERDPAQSQRIASGTIVNGALRLSLIQRQTTTYRVKGSLKESRKLIVLQRRLAGWTLVKPDSKTVEISDGNYRLPFQLAASDQTQTFEAAQEQTQQQELRLLDGNADQIGVYARASELDAKTREALTKVLQLQQGVTEAQRRVSQVDADRKQIVDEQARIRENIGKVPAGSDLQKRYLAALEKQENDLDGLGKNRAEAQKAADTAREALRTYVASLG